ncbi:MAG: hypothetical protein B5M48_00245 [Candidatus Omnitrophica bacterium 4484_213]|nr:MAG: hypothetical protein B5M48_00245 [Candidatus Omnitrophica bacterium 4484_213]
MQENLELKIFDQEYVRLGGFWERFAAYFIDGIILGVASVILNFIPILGQILYFLLVILYFPYFYGTTGQTPGKKILGLKVVRLDGLDLTYGKGFLRGLLGYFISGLIFFGYLMIGWDKKKQGLHDKISGTTVVAKEKSHTILGVILFLLLFILPIVLAVTIVIPKLMQAKNMVMQNAAQNSFPTKSASFSEDDFDMYFNRGTDYLENGDYERAISDLSKAIEIHPNDDEAYSNRGIAYVLQGNHDLAISDFSKAIEINPMLSAAYLNRGRAYDERGNYDFAISDFNSAIKIDPEDASVYYAKAISCENGGHKQQAAEAYKLFIKYASAEEWKTEIDEAREKLRVYEQEQTKVITSEQKEESKEKFTKEDALKAISEIEEKIAKIKSYRVDFKSTAFHPDGAKVEKEGYEICILPDRKKVDANLKTGLLSERIIAITDGENFWQIEAKEKITYRIDLERLNPQVKEIVLSIIPAIEIDVIELKKAIMNNKGGLKEVDNIYGEKIYVFEEFAEAVPAIADELSFLDKAVIYIGTSDGLPKMISYYNKEGKEFMTIFLNFFRINQISEDEFNLPSDWQIIDITDKFKE